MSGQDLGAAMLKMHPHIPILLITGLADPATQEEAKRVGIRNVLFKPITTEMLGREVAHVLANRG
jgi:FixJ family two-component response regulator